LRLSGLHAESQESMQARRRVAVRLLQFSAALGQVLEEGAAKVRELHFV